MIHPEDTGGISRERTLVSFEATLDSLKGDEAGPISRYAITLKNARQLTLVAQYLASEVSFRQVSRALTDTNKVLRIGSIGSCTEKVVIKYFRFLCAINLQRILEVLRES